MNKPVAWHYPGGKADQCTTDKAYAEKDPAWTPMYYKHEWVGLTEEEQRQLWQQWIERERAVGYREGHRAALVQRTWVGLTELEKAEIVNLKWWDWEDTFDIDGFVRAIEAKLKEKNT